MLIPWPRRNLGVGWLLLVPCGIGIVGCASPGAPRPPSLHLPEPVRDLVAVRNGNVVQIRFTAPQRTTDGQPLRGKELQGSLCRQDGPAAQCTPVDTEQTRAAIALTSGASAPSAITWSDALPASLSQGPLRPIAYRVTIKNESGRDAGPSNAVYVAAGAAPPPIQDLSIRGERHGALLQWKPEGSQTDIVLQRAQLDVAPGAAVNQGRPRPLPSQKALGNGRERRSRSTAAPTSGAPGFETLVVPGVSADRGEAIDGTVKEGVRYRYVVIRRLSKRIGGRSLEVQSAPSPPAEFTWHDTYPPPAPDQLTGIGFVSSDAANGTPGPYAVDLVWQPVQDARLAGYLVTRQGLTSTGVVVGTPALLTPSPISTPSFHDGTADPHTAYRYAVSSTDARGNTSSAATVDVFPSPR